MENLDFLIKYLLDERNENDKYDLSKHSTYKKKILFRSLCNIREPKKVSDDFLKAESEYLKEELEDKGEISDFNDYQITKNIYLYQGDITTLKVDCIVNAANSQGLGCFIPCHNCIDNAIHSASGVELRIECDKKMEELGILKTGEAFLTKGYNLPSKYVIHTVGPIIYDVVSNEDKNDLKNCYINSLNLAKVNNIKSIAFPCISTGEFRFPNDMASEIAIKTVKEYLTNNKNSFDMIIFNVFKDIDYHIYKDKLMNI